MQITRDNIDELLDAGALQFNGGPYGWLDVRRDGPTERHENCVLIEWEILNGRSCGLISDHDFDVNGGALSPEWYRVRLQ